jgi:hypothetical protein
MGSGLVDWISWQLLLQSLLFTINYSTTANLPISRITRTRSPFPGDGFITGTTTANHYEVLFNYPGLPTFQNSAKFSNFNSLISVATNRLSLYSLGSDTIENSVFCVVGLVYRAMHSNGRQADHRKHRSCTVGRVCVAGVAYQRLYASQDLCPCGLPHSILCV